MARHALPLLLLCAASGVALSQTASAPAKLPYTLGEKTTIITGPLHDDGSPDYIGALNQKFGKGVTPQNNAYAGLLEILGTESGVIVPKAHDLLLKRLGIPPTAAGTPVFQSYDTYLKPFPERAADAEDWYSLSHKHLWKSQDQPLLADYLKSVDAFLDRADDCIARPRWWVPAVSPNDGMVEMYIPSLGSLREFVNALAARATLRAAAGNFPGFLADVTAMKRLAANMTSGPTVIEHLVGVAMDVKACETIGTVAGNGLLTESQCQDLQKMLASVPPLPPLAASINLGERWTILDISVRLARGEKFPPDTFVEDDPIFLIQPDQADWDVALTFINGEYDKVIASFGQPTLEQVRKHEQAVELEVEQWKVDLAKQDPRQACQRQKDESRQQYGQRVGQIIVASLISSLGRVEELHRRALQEDEMLNLLLSVAAHRAKDGKWPAKLEDVAPGGIKGIPEDIYAPADQKPPRTVRYLVTEKGAQIYSVGSNNTDDGGARETRAISDDIGVGAIVDP